MASSQLYLPHARGSLAPKDERHAVFAQWLIDTYGSAFLARGCGVLDVAGGKGHIGVALGAHGISSVLLDPEAPQPAVSSESHLTTQRGNDTTALSVEATDAGLAGFRRIIREPLLGDGSALLNDSDGVEATSGVMSVGDLLRACSIVVGMHPDQATEPAVDLAIQLGVPFAVVPCCVYPALFPHRRQRRSGHPVRGYESFCQYLVDKALSAELLSPQSTSLPFEGKNVVVYSLPPGGGGGDFERGKGSANGQAYGGALSEVENEEAAAAAIAAEAVACEAYVADCRAELECCATAGKWFQALTILGAMARHPPPQKPKKGRTEKARREREEDSYNSFSFEGVSPRLDFACRSPSSSASPVMTSSSRRPDAACGLFAARACAVSGEWRAALKVLNILKRCKISVDAPILEAVVKACEQSGQWERAEALRKEFPGSVRAEDSNNDMSAKA